MVIVPHESEYEVRVFCPRCGSSDVVLERTDGYFHFYSCSKCSFSIEDKRFSRRIVNT